MAIDPERDYTPNDVLTCDDALSLAVIGYKVRAVDMAEGTFVDYNFAGWRINHAAGASSGWSARSIDYAAEWHVLPDEHYDAYKRVIAERDKAEANTKWGRPTVAPDIQKLGRALRPVPAFEVPVGAVVRDWGLKPAAVVASPPPAPHVGKWGKPVECAPFTGPDADAYHKTLPPVVPTKDKWGRPK
ncbi:hypothetical protein P9A28_gp39 [Sphingomonas phage Eidolon]|uniref:Uncharacterized protein n=1 Tax=Sphingomonas phage Eidolon TaxID=2686311 RepID=A0A6M3TCI0_9CAUD|nr:hypothetical protein P9A28_gp39 [Sphingomonas phage Eidolon]QJD54425.1 hypothetical protein [Sphingomonas phage Eidolon]